MNTDRSELLGKIAAGVLASLPFIGTVAQPIVHHIQGETRIVSVDGQNYPIYKAYNRSEIRVGLPNSNGAFGSALVDYESNENLDIKHQWTLAPRAGGMLMSKYHPTQREREIYSKALASWNSARPRKFFE